MDKEISVNDMVGFAYVVWSRDDGEWNPHPFEMWNEVLDFLQLPHEGWMITKPVYIDEPD